jgi:hypothetical protein
MVLVKATKNSEAGKLPTEADFKAMGNYNEQLVKAGIMQAGEGLHPSSQGLRLHFSKGKKVVHKGPFKATRELVAGFWLWNVRSMDEALEWAKRCPDPMPGEEGELELRAVYEAEEFGKAMTPELLDQEHALRAEMERRKAA